MSGRGTGPGDGVGGDDLARRLSPLVEAEARRVLSEAQLAADPRRVAQGWERRFIADGARADEAIRLYEELGYEVTADPLEAGALTGECDDCQLLMLLKFQTIYTRRKSAGAPRRA